MERVSTVLRIAAEAGAARPATVPTAAALINPTTSRLLKSAIASPQYLVEPWSLLIGATITRFPAIMNRMPLELFVPGRVCLFGEHSDWAAGYRRANTAIEKGYTIIAGTNQGLYARVETHPSALVFRSTMSDGRTRVAREIPMERQALLAEAESGEFFSYVAGVAFRILSRYPVRGLAIDNYRTDLPIGKGLSSSAAACVLTARAFNRMYNLRMTVNGEMEYAYLGEITTPSQCGRMDQGCAFGSRPILMVHDRETVAVEELQVRKPIHMVVVDLGARKDTKEILARLNQCYPFAQDTVARNVQHYLGTLNHGMVVRAADELRGGDAEGLGRLMTEAQRLFDEHCSPACPEELNAPTLHRVLEHPKIQPHVWGGKGVGSQGDGSAQLIARSEADRDVVLRVLQDELGLSSVALDLRPSGRVRKAVITVAGFGTRMYPATKAVKKELFPIVTKDGIAKPILLVIVEEALKSGIDEVCLVVQQGDRKTFEAFLNSPELPLHYHKLPPHLRQYSSYLRELGERVAFVEQDSQEGFGHAVYAARAWVADEPFLLMLGDHIYASEDEVPCARQLLDVYDQHQTSVVGLMRTDESVVANFGTVGGRWMVNGDRRLLTVDEFAEKPNVDYARSNLRVEDVPDREYLTLFGQYVLSPRVFDVLAELIHNNRRDRGEFQLTSALDRLRQEEGVFGYETKGRRFDIGVPASYLETLRTFPG